MARVNTPCNMPEHPQRATRRVKTMAVINMAVVESLPVSTALPTG
jgi:hypothetical protein